MIDPLSNETLGAGMIVGDRRAGRDARPGVGAGRASPGSGHRAAVVAVDDAEAALLLERELFDRGAFVAVTANPSGPVMEIARAAGLILIVTAPEPPAGAIDARRMAPHEAIELLERRGVLTGRDEQLTLGEGI